MSDDKINLNGGETSQSELGEPRYTGESISAAFASSDTAADQTASQDDEAYSDRVSSPLHSEEIVVEHLDELPDVENVEELIGEGHVYDEETAGALVALMFAKEHQEEEALAEKILSDEPAKAENADGTDDPAAAPSMLLDKKHSVTILISLILVVLSIIILPILFNNGSTPEPPPPETGDSGNSATDNYPLIFNYFESDGTITITGFKNVPSELVIPYEIDGKPVTAIGQNVFFDCDSLESVVIGDNVAVIGDHAFYGCNNLTSVVIGNNVVDIDDYAFDNCDSLTSIVIPNSVTSIGRYAFYYCDSLTSVVIPDSVTSIGDYAFVGCSGLKSIVIPDSVTSIGDAVFAYCYDLTIYCEAESKPEGWNSNWNYHNRPVVWGYKPAYTTSDFEYTEANGEITITKYIGNNSEVIIPSKIDGKPVVTIGDNTFYDCDNLTSVVIFDSVTSIGSEAFANCSSLTSIVIPDSVTNIGYYAFAGCDSLTIYYEAESQPEGWASDWNYSNRPVVWGYVIPEE